MVAELVFDCGSCPEAAGREADCVEEPLGQTGQMASSMVVPESTASICTKILHSGHESTVWQTNL